MCRRFTDIDSADLEALTLRSNGDRKRGDIVENPPQLGWAVPRAMKHDHDDCRQSLRQFSEKLLNIGQPLRPGGSDCDDPWFLVAFHG